MTTKQIEAKAQKALLPYKIAAQIRATLDEAKKASGLSAEEWVETERQIIELVGEE